jgi:hypothetical protein
MIIWDEQQRQSCYTHQQKRRIKNRLNGMCSDGSKSAAKYFGLFFLGRADRLPGPVCAVIRQAESGAGHAHRNGPDCAAREHPYYCHYRANPDYHSHRHYTRHDHAQPYANNHTEPHPNDYAFAYADQYRLANRNLYASTYCQPNFNIDTDGNRYAIVYADFNSHQYAIVHTNPTTDFYPNDDINADNRYFAADPASTGSHGNGTGIAHG